MWLLIVFIGLFTLALLFSAHGYVLDPERLVASREAHLWIAGVVLLAAIALDKLGRYRAPVALAGVLFGIIGSYRLVSHEASEPRLQLNYRLAKFFDHALQLRRARLDPVAALAAGHLRFLLAARQRNGR